MPLTKEQFQKAREAGYSIEQIVEFEKRRQTEVAQPQQQRPSVLAQLARTFMRGSPLEQMKTTQYLSQQNIPEVQPGQSIADYQKVIAQQLQPREEEIARKGTLAQFEAPITVGLAISGANVPLRTAKALGKFGILEGLANLIGVNRAIQRIQQPELRDIADIAKVGIEGAIAMQPWKLPKPLKTAETKLAGRIVDSLIKPRHKEFMFGKNPGEAIAKEGIVATNLGNLKDKVQVRTNELMNSIAEIRSNAENFDKKVDVTKTLQPLRDTYTYLKSVGEKTHAAEITRIENALSDIMSSGKDLTKLTISEAYQLKDAVSSMQNWISDNVASHRVNVALRKTYHNIDGVIDKAIPLLESLNSRVSNLISARQAIDNRIEILRRSEPMPTIFSILNLPFEALKMPLTKTTLARLLATRFPKPIPKK